MYALTQSLGHDLAQAHQENHLAAATARRAGRQVATARRAARRSGRRHLDWVLARPMGLSGRQAV